MLDPRFYERGEPVGLDELEGLTGAVAAEGADRSRRFAGVATLDDADGDCVSFCGDKSFLAALGASAAGACFAPAFARGAAPLVCVLLVTAYPQYAYAMAAGRLTRPREHDGAEDDVHPSAMFEDGVVVGRGAVVGADVQVGGGTRIAPGAVIGPGVAIGRDCRIGAGARIGFALIGDRVHVHAGAVIGEPGFGAAPGPRGLIAMPQLGRVILQDDVRVGANSCVDRGAWGDTVVGERTKLDNLVHIGHNTHVGRDCVMAAYTGISGSCVIGDGCMFGGRAGVIDHVTIGAGARIAADAAIMKDVPAGESWAGSPARPNRIWLRQNAWLSRASRRHTGREGN